MKRKLTRRETLAHLKALIADQTIDGPAESATFRHRIEALRSLLDETDRDEVSLADIHSALFDGLKPESCRTAFSKFRSDLSEAARVLQHEFALVQNTVRGKSATQIAVHFEGLPLADLRESLTLQATAKLGQIIQTPPRIVPGVIRIFISFANDDTAKAAELKSLLESTWGERRSHKISFWIFNEPRNGGILAGENNREEIHRAIAGCPLALFLLSPSFSKSKFIREHELPAYFPQQPGRHPIFVNLRNSKPPAAHLSAPLLEQFVFSHKEKSYEDLRDKSTRERFAAALNDHIEEICKKHFGAPGEEPQLTIIATPEPRRPRDFIPTSGSDFCAVDARYHRGERSPDADLDDQGVDAVNDLLAWANDPDRGHYFALLGETGAGKSTTVLLFASALNSEKGPTRAYLFDLRYANFDGLLERTDKHPSLDQLLEAILRRHDAHDLRPEDYLRAVREEGAVLIFDGLDEVFVSLNAKEQDSLMHQLLRALPIEDARKPGAGKLLFTCRTQYFRSNEAERGGFTLQGREGLDFEQGKRASFELARMLPFTEEQIRAYFEANLPEIPFVEIWRLLEKIHELRELATQPYLLNLIRKQLPAINAKVERHETVRAVDLYDGFVSDWSHERNKHHNVLQPEDKNELMERLAVHLWRMETKSLPARDMERWLLDNLVLTPRWQIVYADLLKPQFQESLLSDFRAASFVSRWEGDAFRFAHSSLQEYFLARHLAKALENADLGAWDLPEPSRETFDFLGQHMLNLTPTARNKALVGLARILADATQLENTRLNGLRYYLHGHAKQLPLPESPDLDASNLNLEGWAFHGSAERPLLFGLARFTKANLLRVSFEHLRFQPGADFQNADIRSTRFHDCSLPQANFRGILLDGAFFRECDLHGISLDESASKSSVITHHCPASPFYEASPPPYPSGFLAHGHAGAVTSVAFSPDGRFFISGSYDNTLKLWDATSGFCIRSFVGHKDWVTSVAFCQDGHLILSGSADKTLKLWGATSGSCICSFVGHNDAVNSVAISPNGRLIVSGSCDSTLKLWDPTSGSCIRSFVGHNRAVTSVAFSHDGRLIVSGSCDSTLKLWDATSGSCILSFVGHNGAVTSVAFSQDGRFIISGSYDRTLKLWDTASGSCIRSFVGHDLCVNSVTFSHDGRWVLSGADEVPLLWDTASGSCIRSFFWHENSVMSVAFSPGGVSMISGSYNSDIKLWDAISGSCIRSFVGCEHDCANSALSPDGLSLVVSPSWGKILCWSVDGSSIHVPKDCEKWFNSSRPNPFDMQSDVVGSSVIRIKADKAIIREILPLPNGQSIVREPWDEAEATKPYHEIRWKFVRGPKDAWRWCHVVDPETNAIHPPELAAIPGAFSGPEVGPETGR